MDKVPKISVCIPTYEMPNGIKFLKRSFEMLKRQTFKDMEVVISDDSINDEVQRFVKQYEGWFTTRYIKNLNGKGMAENTNCSLLYAEGELLKILYQDDGLAHENSLQRIVEGFTKDTQWLVTGCTHTDGHNHLPTYNDEIYKGKNTIGSPSVLTIRNNPKLELFETKLTWVLDCDYYYRLNKKFGPPTILNDINVVIGVGPHQTTHMLSDERKNAEIKYLTEKYDPVAKANN